MKLDDFLLWGWWQPDTKPSQPPSEEQDENESTKQTRIVKKHIEGEKINASERKCEKERL